MDVTVIKDDGKTALIEAVLPSVNGNILVRRFVPSARIFDGVAEIEVVEAGIEYGLPFAEIVQPATDIPQRLEIALHNAGIWTMEDLQSKTPQAIGALQSVYRVEIASLLKASENHIKAGANKPLPATPYHKPITKEKK